MSGCGMCINKKCRYCHGTKVERIYVKTICFACKGKRHVKEVLDDGTTAVLVRCENCCGTGTGLDETRVYECTLCTDGKCTYCTYSV